jgi:hypothetical protein
LGRSDEALAELECMPQGLRSEPDWLWERAVLVAELQGRDAAEAVVRGYLKEYSAFRGWRDRAICYKVYCFLGRRQEGIAASREWLRRLGPLFHEDRFGVAQDRYVCGELTDEELLEAAPRRSDRRWVHCLIGLTRLANGDRLGAAAQFSDLEDPGNCLRFFTGDALWLPMWTDAWLRRLRDDPNWPAWIPPREGNAATRQQGSEKSAGASPATQPATAPQEDRP